MDLIEEYIEAQDPIIHGRLNLIRETIRAAIPEAEERGFIIR